MGVLPTKEYSLPNKQKHFLKTVSSMVSQTKAKWPLALCYGHMVIKTKTIYQGGSRGLRSCSLSLKTTESRDKTEPGKLVHLNEGLCCQNGNSVWLGPCCTVDHTAGALSPEMMAVWQDQWWSQSHTLSRESSINQK